MKNLLAAALVTFSGLAATTTASAQSTAPDYPTAQPTANNGDAPAKRASRTATPLTREQQRAQMDPEEAKHDQQMEILEARTGNTSFGRGTGPERQLDVAKGGFVVRKFKASPGTAKQEKGQSHAAGGMVTQGKPLVHHHKDKRKWYLRF